MNNPLEKYHEGEKLKSTKSLSSFVKEWKKCSYESYGHGNTNEE